MKNVLFSIILISILYCSKKGNIKQDNVAKNIYHKKAEKFRDDIKDLDSAFYYYYIAKENYIKNNDSIKAAESLINMAFIQTTKGDFYGSIETSLIANKFLNDEKNSIVKRDLATSYNNMGIASGFLYNHNDAIQFYKKAAEFTLNKEDTFTCFNNIADAYLHKKDTILARKYLNLAIKTKNSKNYARVINNLGKLKLLENPHNNPLPEFYKALKIRLDSKDIEGLNSSYSTLSDYFKYREKNKSLSFAKKMLETATMVENPEDQMQALQKLIELDPSHYLNYFKKFQSLNDSLIVSRGKAKNQFAVIRYDVDQKNTENQNLKLQDTENKINILYRNVVLIILSLLLIVAFFWYKKRKKRLQQEKELEVKNTQLKMSKKVHDVVANGLYHMMIDVQNNPEMDKTRILNDIEKMYEESRDISHENIAEEDFASRFINMITSYSSDEQKVLPVGYKESIWENISHTTQLELYYILREILVNMKKHSQAKLASVKFEKNENVLKIKYTDNGTGINNLAEQKGTGIHNTENRIGTIGGDITFEKNPKGGLIIQITIPIQSKYV
ncbi:signal transduction histidine kinase [Chryseobacterium ginsenosidimutans]|uniref:tetratricopeptide repeat-containing sensor histidine kinase n=1 Tax=Chryseobacterium ginsenosidimutans TaxID=687846 RepID=UPI00278008B0|nr:ATP-binding protein [Chryseobacterium ginsenosidimutans]MDQ0592134.1 signal transduction histidine kinase [Chryseobacterium ginsenosidimutans]